MLIIKIIRVPFTILRMAFLLFILIQTNIVSAQHPNLEFRALDALKDISNINATVIVQDSVGYLWIGTEQGLFRFDGHNIFNYKHDLKDQNSLPPSRINKLLLDSKNILWIATSEGLYKYNRELDNFTPIVINGDLKGISGYNIDVIAEDKEGQIYVAYEKSVYKYNSQKNQFSKVIEIKQGRIRSMIIDPKDNIWIASYFNGGLHYYDQLNHQITSFLNDPANKQSISNNEVFDVALVNETLWIATFGGGINSYNLNSKTFKRYISPTYFENNAIDILIDRKKHIWVCTAGSLKYFDPSTDSFRNYTNDPNNPKSLGKNLWGFYEDHQGNYWTVHTIGGIRVAINKNKFKHFDTNPENLWHTSANNITALSFDGSDHLWIGNYYNGIDVFKLDEQKTDRYIHKGNDRKSIGNGTIFSIFCDSKKQMWVGINVGGLQQFNAETKSFTTYQNRPDDTLSIAINDVRSISEDGNGNLWLALEGIGVDRFDIKSKTFHHYNAKNNHLSTNYIFQVFNDTKGNLWVATSWGLDILRKGEKIFKYFIYNKSDSSSISSNVIHSIHEDAQKNIWIGTFEGLNKFNPETQTFTRYSAGLKNKQVAGILSDQKNNIWISTKAGISKFDPNTQRFTNFDQRDGILSGTFHNNSCGKDGDGNLFFGGSDGIDFFNPDSLDTEKMPPTVVLTDFRLFNKSVTFKNDSSIIDKHISYAKVIKLNYKNNSFAFLYQAINLTHPEETTYAYRLDRFDKDWIYAGSKREANYSNLKPGKYTFRVKAKYDNGNWSEKETFIEIIIVPVWWMTIWFKILMILIVLATTFGVVYWRIKRLSNQRKKLEQLVIERTNEIQNKNELLKSQALSMVQKNDELRASNSTKDKLFSIISHDLRSPFNTILGFQDLLLNDYNELSDADRLGMIRQVHSTTNQVYDLVENLLNWARVQTSNIQYHPVKLNLKEVILDKLDLYRKIAESKGITLNFQIPDSLFAFADINLLETSLRNLTNNAIKFTPGGGNIHIKVRQQHDIIEISVIDSGTGMTKQQIGTLFNLEKTETKNGTNGEMGSGLGLLLCKEFVEKNKGSLTVESQTGKGSTFRFTVPASPIS